MDILSRHWKLYFLEGVVFSILGILAIIMPILFTFSFELMIGALFCVGGAIQLWRTIMARHIPSFAASLVSSILFLLIGIALLAFPVSGVMAITTLIAIFFFIDGCIKMIAAVKMNLIDRWVWVMFSGICEVILAVLIWHQWPSSALWVIGILIGVNLLLLGTTQMMVALEVRKLVK